MLYKITNSKYRELIQNTLDEVNSAFKHKSNEKLEMDNIDDVFLFLSEKHAENIALSSARLSEDLDVITLCIATTGLLSKAFGMHEDKHPIFPREWIGQESVVNPDFIISNMLCTLTNYALSIDVLIRRGLDTQARSQLRVFIELS